MSPLLINRLLLRAIKVAMAFVPAVLVSPRRLLTVTPEGVMVTAPAPNCTIMQLKPAGKPAGTVSAILAALLSVMIFPLSLASKV